MNTRIVAALIALLMGPLFIIVFRHLGIVRPRPLPAPGTLGPEAVITLDLSPQTLRVGERAVIDLTIRNPGSVGFDGLAWVCAGDWSSFRFAQLDVDGSVQRGSAETVFRFNGGVKPGGPPSEGGCGTAQAGYL